jgi:hypothetical protein
VKRRPNAVRLGFVVGFSVLWTLVLWMLAPGLFGLDEDLSGNTSVTATVTRGAGCTDAGEGEVVTFKQDGEEYQAKLDACGHREGEPVDVSVPHGTDGEIVVHAAEAAAGESDGGRPLAFSLCLLACFAGGCVVYRFVPPKLS